MKNVRVRKSDPCALLKEKTVLLHAAYHMEIAEPYFARSKQKAVESAEVLHAEKREQLLCLRLYLFDRFVRKARRAVVGHMAQRKMLLAQDEYLVFGIVSL